VLYFKMFHLQCINLIQNIFKKTNKTHFSIYDVFYSQNSQQHVPASTPDIPRVILLHHNAKIHTISLYCNIQTHHTTTSAITPRAHQTNIIPKILLIIRF
jgi:hypothetical protein